MAFQIQKLYISTHAPLAGRDKGQANTMDALTKFQPTRPLRGATIEKADDMIQYEFQPTRPLRGATARFAEPRALCRISTHAPLAGRDGNAFVLPVTQGDFNPRAPCGARPSVQLYLLSLARFQPTRPLRGATREAAEAVIAPAISTHAPLAGRDWGEAYDVPYTKKFQPTRPLRGATKKTKDKIHSKNISTHAPLAGRD